MHLVWEHANHFHSPQKAAGVLQLFSEITWCMDLVQKRFIYSFAVDGWAWLKGDEQEKWGECYNRTSKVFWDLHILGGWNHRCEGSSASIASFFMLWYVAWTDFRWFQALINGVNCCNIAEIYIYIYITHFRLNIKNDALCTSSTLITTCAQCIMQIVWFLSNIVLNAWFLKCTWNILAIVPLLHNQMYFSISLVGPQHYFLTIKVH